MAWNKQGLVLKHEALKSLCYFPSTYIHGKISHARYVITEIGKTLSPVTTNSYFTGVFTFFRVLI